MKNITLIAVVSDSQLSSQVAGMLANEELRVDSIIDQHRFADRGDRALALFENEDGLALFPDADELRDRGINVSLLADMLEAGKVEADSFGDTLRNLSVDDLNGALEHLADIVAEEAEGLDFVDRVLRRYEPEETIEPFDMNRMDFGPRDSVVLVVEV